VRVSWRADEELVERAKRRARESNTSFLAIDKRPAEAAAREGFAMLGADRV
jgi:hypothetical protein